MTAGDRVIRCGLVVALTAVTGIAVAISYGHLYDLAKENGERGAAAAAVPVTVDGLILACSLVIVSAARDRSRPPVLAWLMLLARIGATLAGNVAHGIEHGWAGSLVAGWPAVVAAGMFHLAISEIRRGRNADQVESFPEVSNWSNDTTNQPDGYALGDLVEPEPVPALATVAQTDDPGPDLANRHHGADLANPCHVARDPGLAPVVAGARDHFAEVLAAGALPSVRAVRRELHLGHPRAAAVRAALAEE